MEKTRLQKLLGIVAGVGLFGLLLLTGQGYGQTGTFTHTIFMTGLEVKGGTSADKLAPPAINPDGVYTTSRRNPKPIFLYF